MLTCLLFVASTAVLSADYPLLSAEPGSERHVDDSGTASVLSARVFATALGPELIAPLDAGSESLGPANFEPDTEYFMPAVPAPYDANFSMQMVEIDRAREYFIRVPKEFDTETRGLGRLFRRPPVQE